MGCVADPVNGDWASFSQSNLISGISVMSSIDNEFCRDAQSVRSLKITLKITNSPGGGKFSCYAAGFDVANTATSSNELVFKGLSPSNK